MHAYTHIYTYTHMCTTSSECVLRCVRWCKKHTCVTYTPAHALVPKTPVKCMQHSLQKKCTYIYIYTYMFTHAYAHENTCACMTPSARWSTDTKTHNLCTNMHKHTHTHVYKRIDVQIHTHMHIYTYIMSAHIHTYIYIHTRTQNVHMNTRKAPLKRQRGSDCAGSPTWRQEALPFSLSAAIWRRIPFVASSPIARPQGMTDKRRTTTTNSSLSHHHDSAPSRPHPLICTGAELIHPIDWPRNLPAWPWPPETRSFFCHFGGFSFWRVITLPAHFHMHIQRHTRTSTHVKSAHKRNGDNQTLEPGWEGRKNGFVKDLAHTHKKRKTEKKMSGKTDIHESQEKIRAHRASNKATRLCLTK